MSRTKSFEMNVVDELKGFLRLPRRIQEAKRW